MRKSRAKHWDVILVLPDETVVSITRNEKWGEAKALLDLARLRDYPFGSTLVMCRTAKDENVQVVEGLVLGSDGWVTLVQGDQLAATPLFPSAGGNA